MTFSPGAPITPTFLFVIAAVLALVGVVMLRLGWWPRRRGQTPHCRRCGYALVGNESGRCPECGTDTTVARNVRRGERHRRGGVAALGAMALVLALLCGGMASIVALREVDWYQFRPATWVVDDAGSSDPAESTRAWRELERRRGRAGLSEAVERKLGGVALAEVSRARASEGPLHQPMVDFLADRFLAGTLPAEQADQFFDLATEVELRVRPVVRSGDRVPYSLRSLRRVNPTRGEWRHRFEELGVWVDGVRVGRGGSGSREPELGMTGQSASVAIDAACGERSLEVRYRMAAFRGRIDPASANPDADPCWVRERASAARFTVAAPGSGAPDARLVRRPELDAAVRASMNRPIVVSQRDPGSPGAWLFLVTAECRGAPTDLAFDLLLRDGAGVEHWLGQVKWRQGESGGSTWQQDRPARALTDAKHLDVIFRASADAARGTVDLYDLWEGEIVFADVPVKRWP